MNLFVLNKNYEQITILDTYDSFIWSDRYDSYGDFEIKSSLISDILEKVSKDFYLQYSGSDRTMIIDEVLIDSDDYGASSLTVRGRSLEWILNRRIIWNLTTLDGSFQDGILKLLEENVIKPSISDRKIDNFIFESTDDEFIKGLTLKTQYAAGDNLYDVIEQACKEHNIGFKITLNDKNQFVFKLYNGEDRSYNQDKNPYVMFSPSLDNLTNSNYLSSNRALKNVGLVGGEGEGTDRKFATVGEVKGLDRREMFINAGNTSTDASVETTNYEEQLKQKGKEELAKNFDIETFEGETRDVTYVLGKDYHIGDIVEIVNEHGNSGRVRILEIVTSISSEIKIYPTFKSVNEKGDII